MESRNYTIDEIKKVFNSKWCDDAIESVWFDKAGTMMLALCSIVAKTVNEQDEEEGGGPPSSSEPATATADNVCNEYELRMYTIDKYS